MKLFYKVIFISSIFLITISSINGQTHVQFGLLSGTNKLEDLTPNDFSHSGWRVGVDQTLIKSPLSLLLGVHYVRFNDEAKNGTNFFDTDPATQILKTRAGIQMKPLAFGKIFGLRLKGLLSYNYFLAFEGGQVSVTTDKLKSGYLNVDVGAGLNIGMLTVDLEYEIGLNNVIDDLSDSQFRFLSISAGILF